jgi:hypothetical protein
MAPDFKNRSVLRNFHIHPFWLGEFKAIGDKPASNICKMVKNHFFKALELAQVPMQFHFFARPFEDWRISFHHLPVVNFSYTPSYGQYRPQRSRTCPTN